MFDFIFNKNHRTNKLLSLLHSRIR